MEFWHIIVLGIVVVLVLLGLWAGIGFLIWSRRYTFDYAYKALKAGGFVETSASGPEHIVCQNDYGTIVRYIPHAPRLHGETIHEERIEIRVRKEPIFVIWYKNEVPERWSILYGSSFFEPNLPSEAGKILQEVRKLAQ